MSAFRFTRRTEQGLQRTERLADLMGSADLRGQTWLFLSPHDDDLCVGGGLFMQAAVQAGVDVQALVVTDGCMGYCREDQRDTIVDIRRRETYQSFSLLGVPPSNVSYVGYPDGGLMACIGRRRARDGEPSIQGHFGLQNAFTYYLRKFRPSRVFVPTHTDLHPDHRITNSELMISIFHAQGSIWPELGQPLESVPKLGELAVYCMFESPPNLEIIGDDPAFDTKLRSIAAYKSQEQIVAAVAELRDAGPYEYILEAEFRLYSPQVYRSLFC